MGWLRYAFLGDFGQQLDLEDQKTEIEQLRRQLRAQRAKDHGRRATAEEIEQLASENEELRLFVAVIFRVLVRKGIIPAAELREWVDALDAEDGDADGSFRGDVLPEK